MQSETKQNDEELVAGDDSNPQDISVNFPQSISRRPGALDPLNPKDWTPDIQISNSPASAEIKESNGITSPASVSPKTAGLTPQDSKSFRVSGDATNSPGKPPRSMPSPCFVHSHLDKGGSLSDWLRNRNAAPDHQKPPHILHTSPSRGYSSLSEQGKNMLGNDDDDFGESLTKQLADTAVGVREMSKQLGRARVRSHIHSVLVITKSRDNRLISLTRELALHLMLKKRNGDRGVVVYVDHQLRKSRRFDAEGIERDYPEICEPLPRRRSSSSNSLASMSLSSTSTNHRDEYIGQQGQLRYWTSDMCSRSPHLFDFVVTLGGDGTVLFTSWLFQRIVPPVLSFALGSLGFLTNFDFADHKSVMDSAIDSGIRVNLRMRFTCTVYRTVTIEKGRGRKAVKKGETGEIMMKNLEKGGWEAVEGSYNMSEGVKGSKDKEIMCFTTRPVETFEVLNDLVVDRGPSPYVSLLELFGDEHHMTTVQADGLTVSTPTGSTAYSLSAGGSLVHPEIPALLITPICPHTLSFRPMLLPDSMELRICVPFNSRSTAWASFDGRGRVELKQGDHIKVTASKYPFPTVCADNQSTDWFHSISRTLKWNERERQKSFVVVEEDGSQKAASPPSKQSKLRSSSNSLTVEEEGEDEDEDAFDINDSSPEAAAEVKRAECSTPQNALNKVKEEMGKYKMVEVIAEESAHQKDSVKNHQDPLLGSQGRSPGRPLLSARNKSRSRSRSRSRQHPAAISPRHVEFKVKWGMLSDDSEASASEREGHGHRHGLRDDIHSPRSATRSQIPSSEMKTPTLSDHRHNHIQSKKSPNGHHFRNMNGRDVEEHHPPRAFAVWGQDLDLSESDSNTSDSDA